MPIITNLDVMLAKRKMSLTQLSKAIGLSLTNLSLLKNGKIGPAPKYLRVWLYDYHFTSITERSESGNWWKRDNHRLILPKFSKEEIWIP